MSSKSLIFLALSVFPISTDHSRISSLLFHLSRLNPIFPIFFLHAEIRFLHSSLFSLLSSLMLRPLPFLVLLT